MARQQSGMETWRDNTGCPCTLARFHQKHRLQSLPLPAGAQVWVVVYIESAAAAPPLPPPLGVCASLLGGAKASWLFYIVSSGMTRGNSPLGGGRQQFPPEEHIQEQAGGNHGCCADDIVGSERRDLVRCRHLQERTGGAADSGLAIAFEPRNGKIGSTGEKRMFSRLRRAGLDLRVGVSSRPGGKMDGPLLPGSLATLSGPSGLKPLPPPPPPGLLSPPQPQDGTSSPKARSQAAPHFTYR